ncbi:LacI family DNA-binding transcriptional regulator [Lentzea sp. E54]|uniref:LacI family DNA-binding transcriptional regulator n=1 Tax=Lentzea xerophila TaxID=3435883 RepID=UPI003DA55CD2
MGRTRVTLADVAAASGVSVTTASLVLTGRARELRISEAAERRVRSTAQELGYRRGVRTTGPRSGRSRTIGFVLDSLASSRRADDLVKGAVRAAYRHGFMLLVAESGGDPAKARTLADAMRDRQTDGIVFASTCPTAVAVPHGPAVLLNAAAPSWTGIPSVMTDEVQGGRSAARVLVEAGHRHGVHLIGAGPEPCDGIGERLVGMREVFEAAGVEVVSAPHCPKWTSEDGYAATRRLLRHHRPKALVCLDDHLAFGAYQALGEAGLSVPGDVSVLGFGDHPVASWLRPRLTTIALPHLELGARAVEVLVELVERRGLRQALVHRVPMPVREGGSVARPGPDKPGCLR